MLKLMTDMDDVMTSGGFLYLLNQYMGTHYTEEFFKGFYMQDILKGKDKEDFFKWFIEHNQYDYCTINTHCVEVLKELNEVYKVYIGTSYIFRDIPYDSGHILVQKHDYLKEKFPFIKPSQYIFITDKSVLNMDIKIDDRPDNLVNCNTKLLFTAFHNKDISDEELEDNGMERVNGWDDIKVKLLKK